MCALFHIGLMCALWLEWCAHFGWRDRLRNAVICALLPSDIECY